MSTDSKPSTSVDKDKKGTETQVWIALIGALSAIIIAIINSQTIVGWILRPTATPTATVSTPLTDTPISVVLPVVTNTLPVSTDTLAAIEPTLTLTIATETPSLPIGMHVRLYADRTSGKALLEVRLDARDSFLRAPGGEIYGCKSGACNYTWQVYAGGQRVGKPEENSTGTFRYRFGRKGSYVITVWVCRGGGSSDCNGSGAQFEVR